MCLKDHANSHISRSSRDGAQYIRNCFWKYGGESQWRHVFNRKLATHRIRTWTPGWQPAVITTDWDTVE